MVCDAFAMKWAWTILIDLGKQCKRWGDTDFGPASTAQLVRNPVRTGLDGWQLLGLREERKEGTKGYKVIQSHPQANVQPWSSKFQISYAHSWSFSRCWLGSFTLISVETHILPGTVAKWLQHAWSCVYLDIFGLFGGLPTDYAWEDGCQHQAAWSNLAQLSSAAAAVGPGGTRCWRVATRWQQALQPWRWWTWKRPRMAKGQGGDGLFMFVRDSPRLWESRTVYIIDYNIYYNCIIPYV